MPAGFAFAPAVGGIGLDTAAGLPVVNIGGTTQQIALTSSMTQVGTSNVWMATLYSSTSGLSTIVQCGVRGFYCLTQAPSQLQYVRFGTVWGIALGSEAALSQDRDFWYDSTNSILYVYSAGGNSASHYSTVAPIVLSGQSVLNINGH